MNKNSWIYTSALLFALLLTIWMASSGTVQSVINDGDITLSTSRQEYQGDEKVVFHAVLEFGHFEQASIERIELEFTNESPLDLTVNLPMPLNEGVVVLSEENGADSLNPIVAIVRFIDIIELGDVFPSPTPLTFKGIGESAKIEIELEWDPDQSTQAITGDYTATLNVQLNGVAELKKSNAVMFSIVPVTLTVLAPDEVPPNTEFEATIEIDKVTDMAEASFLLLYDEDALELIDNQVQACLLLSSENETGELNLSFECVPPANGGPIALTRLIFKTAVTIEAIDSPLEITGVGLRNTEFEPIPSTKIDALVVITPECGDVDGDGKRTALDASETLKIALGLIAPTSTQSIVSDLDTKNGVNVTDTILLLQRVAKEEQFTGLCGTGK